jgi:plastocyanin
MPKLVAALVGALALPLAFSAIAACSDDDTPNGGSTAADGGGDSQGGDANTSKDAGHGGHDSAVADSGPPPIRCTEDELEALDVTDGGALEITFELLANPKQYVNRCATVKAGATVIFSGGFRQHPLEPAGGDSPNPIPSVSDNQPDNRLEVTLPSPGTFGFQCTFHPAQMFGAIRVVP